MIHMPTDTGTGAGYAPLFQIFLKNTFTEVLK